MPIVVLKQVNHIRVKPLPLADRRSIQRPRPGPLLRPVIKEQKRHSLATRPRQVTPTKERVTKKVPVSVGYTPPPIQIPDNKLLQWKGTGRILIIIGNGPSHKMADLPRLKSHPLIDMMAINKPDDRVWPTQYWFFCDNSQYRRHIHLWDTYHGTIINTTSILEKKENNFKIKSLGNLGFSLDMNKGLYIGRSSVYAAMQISTWMDYNHVYIFGCDMSAVGGKLYPWGTNPDVRDDERARRFDVEAKSYTWAAQYLHPGVKKKFTFCSEFNPYDFIDKFEMIPHNIAVDKILERANILLQGKPNG